MHRFFRFGRFLSPDGGQGGGPAAGQVGSQSGGQQGQGGGQVAGQQIKGSTQAAGQQAEIDYAKIQQMLEGTLKAKEDTALKAYFKQQGLSQEEAEKAMEVFKTEKAKNTPDAAAMQEEIAREKALAQKALVEKEATMTAVSLGLDAKTIPYVLKLADLSNVTGKDGKINEEAVKTALNKVLEDVPQFKPANKELNGFQIGGSGGQQDQQQKTEDQNRVPTKRWNRFNN